MIAIRARPLAVTGRGQANARRSCTKSASSQRPTLTLNSSADRHDWRTSAAARSGAWPRSSATSALRSSRRSAWIVGALGAVRDDDEVAVPGCELLELSEQLLALGPPLHALDPLLGISRRQVEPGHDHLLPDPSPSAPRRSTASSRARDASAGWKAGSRYGPRAAAMIAARRSRTSGSISRLARSSRPPATLAIAVASASPSSGARAGEPRREPRAPRAGGTGRAGSASGSSRAAAELVGDQHERCVERRLLEILEQGVGGVVVEQVRAEQEIDAAIGLERTQVEVVMELPDRRRSGSCRRAARRPGGRDASAPRPAEASPSCAPAKAKAAVVLPTPAGPWKRNAWASPSPSAAVSSRFASYCSGTVARRAPWISSAISSAGAVPSTTTYRVGNRAASSR